MLFISTNDRNAGVQALTELFRYMHKQYPQIPARDELRDISNEELQKRCEEQWNESDHMEREAFLAMHQSLCPPNGYYECHVTIEPSPGNKAEKESEYNRDFLMLTTLGYDYGFAASKIDGDEKMGKGVKWYLTRSQNSGATLAEAMYKLTKALEEAGFRVLRRKVEHIVFDECVIQIAGTTRAA
jgi:hypothetical protein